MSTTTGTSTIKTTYSLNLHYKQKVWTFPVDFGCMTFNEEKTKLLFKQNSNKVNNKTPKKKQKFPDDKKGCLNWNT